MKLTPHQILQKLGFNIPVDGVHVADVDEPILSESLRIAGVRIDLRKVPDSEFVAMDSVVCASAVKWRMIPNVEKERAAHIMRSAAIVSLQQTLNFKPHGIDRNDAPKKTEPTGHANPLEGGIAGGDNAFSSGPRC